MRLFIALCFLLFLGCSLPFFQGNAVLVRPLDAPRTFLWELREPGGTQAFLFGSIHLADKGLYPLPPHVEDAFARSSLLLLELIPDHTDAPALLSASLLPHGTALATVLDAPTNTLLSQRLKQLELEPSSLQAYRPWAAAMALTAISLAKLGYQAEDGIDRHFFNLARGKMATKALETVQEQLAPFLALNAAQQQSYLRTVLYDLEGAEKTMLDLLAAYRAGDGDALQGLLYKSLSNSDDLSPLYRELLDKRSEVMAKRLEELLRERTSYFAVVGAGHLVGSKGIPALLAARGISAVQW